MADEVTRPVFVIGTGRCGLSLVVDLLARHHDLAWFSQWTDRYPRSRWAPSIPYWYRKPIVRQLFDLAGLVTRKRWKPHPDESFNAFTASFRGFARPYRPLTALDIDRNARRGIYQTVLTHIRGQRKERFVTELSGWARIVFLREVFPDAQFIHVVRDPRPTVNSLLYVDWWRGWHGEFQWRWGPIPDAYRRFVSDGTPSFAALAGVHYNILIDNILEEAKTLDDSSYIEVRFEDVVRETEPALRRLCGFAGLDWTDRYDRAWRGVKVFDPNNRKMRIAPWRENLSDAQKGIIEKVCAGPLRRFGYLDEE